jgi:hypothetical protein
VELVLEVSHHLDHADVMAMGSIDDQ